MHVREHMTGCRERTGPSNLPEGVDRCTGICHASWGKGKHSWGRMAGQGMGHEHGLFGELGPGGHEAGIVFWSPGTTKELGRLDGVWWDRGP